MCNEQGLDFPELIISGRKAQNLSSLFALKFSIEKIQAV